MSWQDITITIASLVFALSLIPQVYLGFKEKKGVITYATSIPTCAGLCVIGIAYFSLGLYFSFAVTCLTTALWFTLFLQRVFYKKNR